MVTEASSPVSFRVRYTKLGGHIHARIWSSEFGPETTHGCNGTLVFRESEWPTFQKLLELGAHHYSPMPGVGLPVYGVVEFIEEAAS